MNYYKPRYFKPQELVPQSVYNVLKDDSIRLFDARMLYTIDCLREYFAVPLMINDWLYGGVMQYRGFRPNGCSVGAAFSMHRFGGALDLSSKYITAKEMRLKILECSRLFPYITRMEDEVDWLHIDNANVENKGILLFKP